MHHDENFGHVPDGWRVVRLADVADLWSGGTPSKQRPEFWNGNIPWASPKDLKRLRLADTEDHISEAGLEEGSRLVPAGAVFIVVRGMILSRDVPVGLATVPMAFNQDMKAIIARGDIDSGFLLYGLSAYKNRLRHEIGSAAHGTKRISTSAIQSFRLPIPSLPEQRAIAHVLRTVQQAKEATEQVIAAARQLKQSLMRHLFIYGPVPFDQADRVPLKETGLGSVAQHWKMSSLGEVICSGPQNGVYKPKSDYGTGVPIVRINDFDNDGSVIEVVPNRVRLSEDEIGSYGLSTANILVNRVNSLSHLGKTAIIGQIAEPTVFESNMMRFGVDADRIRPGFVFRFLNLPAIRRLLCAKSKRAVAQSSVNQEDVKGLPLPIPPVEEQDKLLQMIAAVEAKLRSESARMVALDALFQTLLHNLMTGKVRVKHSTGAPRASGGK